LPRTGMRLPKGLRLSLCSNMESSTGGLLLTHAIILDSVLFKETDKVLSLLSLDHGKFSVFAKSAVRSTVRFSGGLEPLTHVKAHLKTGRSLWRLEKIEYQSAFIHLRSSFDSLQSAAFVLRLVKDLIPDGPVEPAVFRALGRFLRDSEQPGFGGIAGWAWLSFWTWLAFHTGVGDISEPLHEKLRGPMLHQWHELLASREPSLKELFALLIAWPAPKLTNSDYILVYRQWLRVAGIKWQYFENQFFA
jgi:hypothetical protein